MKTAVDELTPVLGHARACWSMGLWRGASLRRQAQAHRRALVGPLPQRPPRHSLPLALDVQSRQIGCSVNPSWQATAIHE